MKVGKHEIEISNRDKLFFPEVDLTKGDLIDYYQKIAEVMLPHLQGYGISMQRFPDGLQGESWYEKDAPDYFPAWIETVKIPKREGGSFNAPVIGSEAGLVYLANQAVVTLHAYLAQMDHLEKPDKLIYDLDPPEENEDFGAVRDAALALHDLLDELGLSNWVQTTGSKGFHVVLPLDQSLGFDAVRDFAVDTARVLVRRNEDQFTLEQRKAKRGGRIYLDTNRNTYGATSVAPYSVRARPDAAVATPLDWDEVRSGANPRDWTMENIFQRLGQKEDPWKEVLQRKQSLSGRRARLDDLLENETPAKEEK